MNKIVVLLAVALVVKDGSYLGDPYLLRGIAQLGCLVAGVCWLLTSMSARVLKNYWVVYLYTLILLLGALGSVRPIYVTLQVCSLFAVMIFFVAYNEARQPVKQGFNSTLILSSICLYWLVAVASLVLIFINKNLVYDEISRFSGVFSKSAMLGAASGLLVGFVWFLKIPRWFKPIGMLPGLVCLAMTLSRTYWLALILAIGLTSWRYFPDKRKFLFVFLFLALCASPILMLVDMEKGRETTSSIIRYESVGNLSGRVDLWKRGWAAFLEQPLLGYGFTTGASGLSDSAVKDSRELGRTTLHNGYMQALLDSGLLGFMCYITFISLALWKIYHNDPGRHFPIEFFSLHFLVLANLNESMIYSASVFHNIIFWAFAIFALSLSSVSSEDGTGHAS